MSRRALVEKRPFLVLSVLVAGLYYYLQGSSFPELYAIPVKGCAAGLLAVYSWLRHSSRSARLLTVALVFAALGDMLVNIDLRAGAAAFAVFHIITATLFLRHRRKRLRSGDGLMAIVLLIGTPVVAYGLPHDPDLRWPVTLYALALAAMATSAWVSDFPRISVGAGALLFVISDLLIFAGLGPLSGSPLPDRLIWPVYYAGIFLLTVGVITTLRKRDRAGR